MELDSLLKIKRKTHATTKRRKNLDLESELFQSNHITHKKSKKGIVKPMSPLQTFTDGTIYSNYNTKNLNTIVETQSIVSACEEEFDELTSNNFSVHEMNDSNYVSNSEVYKNIATSAMNEAVSAMIRTISSEEDFFENKTYREFEKERQLGQAVGHNLSRNSSLVDLAMGIPSNYSRQSFAVPDPMKDIDFE